jgi:hypothetical protein
MGSGFRENIYEKLTSMQALATGIWQFAGSKLITTFA